MKHSLFKRLKQHSFPGDVPKIIKIEMREGKHPDKKRSKTYRKVVNMRAKATLKERTKQEINDAYQEIDYANNDMTINGVFTIGDCVFISIEDGFIINLNSLDSITSIIYDQENK